MADKTVKVILKGEDQSASAAFKKVGKSGDDLTKKISGSMQKLGSAIGGEFGEVVNKVSEGLDAIGERGKGAFGKIAVAGGALAGVGALLTGMGDKEKAASQQLDQAIENTGNNAEDFQKQIESTVHSMEKYGDSAATTKNALQILTSATHDPTKALSLMGEAADLAAAKHESLDAASTQLARVLGGKGGRTLAQYNVQLVKNADGTTDWTATNEKLAQVLSGQASAAADTFTGRLKGIKTEIGDQIAMFGQKYGPAITGLGTGLLAAGSVAQIFAARSARVAAANAASATSSEADAAAIAAQGEAAAATATELTGLAVASERAGVASAAGAGESAAAGAGGLLSKIRPLAASAGPILAIGAAIVGAGAAINHLDGDYARWAVLQKTWGDLTSNNKQAIDALTQSIQQDGGVVGVYTDHLIGAQAQQSGLAKTANDAGVSLATLITGVTGTDDQFAALSNTLLKSGKLTADQKVELAQLRNALLGGKTAAGDDATATTALGNAQQTAADKAAAQKAAVDALTKSFDALGTAQISDLQSQDAFLSSLDSVTAGVQQNGTSLSVNSEKGRANREAFLNAGQAALSYAQAQQKNGVAIPTVTKNLQANVTQLERTAAKAGFSKTQVYALVHQMGLTPKQIATTFRVNTQQAYDAITTLTGKAEYLHSLLTGGDVTDYLAISVANQSAFGGGGHAGGSPFYEGGTTLVGERGPERVRLPRGSQIQPYSASGGGGDTYVTLAPVFQVHSVTGTIDPASQKQIVTMLENWASAGGKLRIGRAVN